MITKCFCYRCGNFIDNEKEPLYEIQAISWIAGTGGSMGTTTGNAFLCSKCADGLENYLDKYWRKEKCTK